MNINSLSEIQGTFDGENMLGEDMKTYQIPPNYASKSKLIEGDQLKLIIAEDGAFIFKQTHPTNRVRLTGFVTQDYKVEADGQIYNILRASITYYKAKPGDQAVIITPSEFKSEWAALENIIRNND